MSNLRTYIWAATILSVQAMGSTSSPLLEKLPCYFGTRLQICFIVLIRWDVHISLDAVTNTRWWADWTHEWYRWADSCLIWGIWPLRHHSYLIILCLMTDQVLRLSLYHYTIIQQANCNYDTYSLVGNSVWFLLSFLAHCLVMDVSTIYIAPRFPCFKILIY